ncbi:oxygen-independent coproporphyrinogen III oxidase [Marinobacter pelagius]|uniref:oxygen-independent coproporphyrinogen III oxidase n=1 Tax=Marinobacter sp. C7 TaxID=2951363 RepID=UPI001EF0E108|nr:oxygen-independent coproporphyrinogen III oxidase [Marinobacter sp. C7]MCG7200277.1 oxygen-independent coproporphyrinogen III oxidase [Marinobacter sp. C7]
MLVDFNAALLAKYDTYGPRYTSYPTAVQFSDEFGEMDYRLELEQSNQQRTPLSLYFHIPFCKSLCFYCACAKIITNKQERTIPYLERIHAEIVRQAELVDPNREVSQLHFGGGTPTYLHDDQLAALLGEIARNFTLAPPESREFSIEIDPRAVRDTTIPLLYELGFNRISLGVQDFDPRVQAAVNRIQSVEQTFAVIDAARAAGYRSTNVDLIYGLPHQTVDSFSTTLDTVLSKRPERLAIYNYAHMPDKVKAQKLINVIDLPSPETKLAILEMTVERLQGAGYVYLGMDHFALPDDELTLAKSSGQLQRNFQGYSTYADTDLIGIGMTSIGRIHHSFSQNMREEDDYFKAIDSGALAIARGYRLSLDDQIRRDVIQALMCQNEVVYETISQRYGIDFFDYFCKEMRQLAGMAIDSLVVINPHRITVTPTGQLLLRNIAMVFDAYLDPSESQRQFSRVI